MVLVLQLLNSHTFINFGVSLCSSTCKLGTVQRLALLTLIHDALVASGKGQKWNLTDFKALMETTNTEFFPALEIKPQLCFSTELYTHPPDTVMVAGWEWR